MLQGSSGSSTTPPAGPLVQKQITVIQVPTLDKSKDKANKAVVEMSKEDLMQAVVSIVYGCTKFDSYKSSRIMNSNPTVSGFGENLFWGHRTICLMKLIASTMLSAVIKRQYSSVLPFLCFSRHCLPVFDEKSGKAMNFVFLSFEYH